MRILKYALICSLIANAVVNADDLIVKETNDIGLTVEFTPQNWQIREKKINHRSYYSVRFSEDDFLSKPGQPMVPTRVAIIGIPLDAQVDYQIEEIFSGEALTGKLIPTPAYTPSNEFEYFEEPDIYNKSQLYPPNIAELEQPGFIRNQRVISLKLSPLQYFPSKNEIRLIKKIVIKLNFSRTSLPATRFQPKTKFDKSESNYENVILNYQQAKDWRKSPIKKSQTLKKGFQVLSDSWYKIYTKREGIYKITGKMLADNGITINTIDPVTIRIYNNGGRELPRGLYVPRPDSLIENAILVVDNHDGKFDESDYILFYGKGIQGWDYDPASESFSHYINRYTYENVYWLSWGNNQPGKRMTSVALPIDDQIPLQTSFWDHLFFEEDLTNPIYSGIDWYGISFGNKSGGNTDNKTFTFNLKGAVAQDLTEVKIQVAGISAGEHKFQFYMNDKYLGGKSFYAYSSKYIVISTSQFSHTTDNILVDGYNQLRLEYTPSTNIAKAHLDWIELHHWRSLVPIEDEIFFYAPISAGSYRYQLSDFSKDDIVIFDITDFDDVRKFDVINITNGRAVFVDTVNVNHPKRYLALTPDRYQTPLKIEKDVPSDLRATTHAADFIIITHDDFYDQALPLKSLRENCDNLKTEVVKISDVYDEFSWGLFDPVAIRDFIKYAYENWTLQPRYILLFGSGDFDYRNILDPVDHNWIPPFETTEKYEGDSRARDDWYVCVNGEDDYLDLAIGRLPVRNPDQAKNVVQKIIDYNNNPLLEDWRNTITVVADDEYGESITAIEPEHIEASEAIAEDYIPSAFNINKIYLTEYPAVYTASIVGIRKPAAQQAIMDAINRGCLVINYIGHGRYDLWAHEVVLMMSQDMQKINNGRKQALWVAATCYFGRFDNPNYESMAEELVLMEDNGAIAVFAATRLVSSGPNASLNKLFYSKLFPTAHYKIRLGDAVTNAKNARGNYENDQKTMLFGDPTLYLANPSFNARVTTITPDTIKALSQFTISGEIQKNGAHWQDFNGNVLLRTFDSKKHRTYIIDENLSLKYILPGNTIFRGTATVNQGQFNFKFIVPKDITYGGNLGRLSLYFWNNEVDGSGYMNSLPVGGTETNLFDDAGPQITIRFNNEDFDNGGFTDENPTLNIEISDSLSGVNIAGDLGHNIALTLDEEKVILNDLFNYYNDSYLAGSINYKVGPLNEGAHTLTVKAWDNSNNSSQTSSEFIVIAGNKLVLGSVLNYPNPFSSSTEFTFWTNQAGEASIKIYSVAGRLIKKIDNILVENGFNHVYWDGCDEEGDPLANGIYLYKISAKSHHEGKTISAEAIEKLMIMR